MSGIYKFIHFISDIGKLPDTEGVEAKRITLINWISFAILLICIGILPLYELDIIAYKGANMYRMLLLALFSVLSIISNYFKRYHLARLLISFAFGFFIFVYPLITGIIVEGFFLWFPFGAAVLSIFPYLLFDLKGEWPAVAISVLFYAVFVVYGDKFLLTAANNDLDVAYIYNRYELYKVPQVIFWLFLNIMALILVLTNDYTNRKLHRAYLDIKEQSDKIKEQSDEINAQNEELKSQSEQIVQVNESLEKRIEDRTEKLEHQNKMLSEYAYINAHLLRSPLSNILGLIYLLKMIEDEEERNEIIERLDTSADKMNEVVKRITEVVEKGSKLTREEFIEIRRNVLED